MPITYNSVLYGIAIIAIVSFCFWKPDFPKKMLTEIGIHSFKAKGIFLAFYWINIPVIIHFLMTMMWQS
jgi:hypothetical protein